MLDGVDIWSTAILELLHVIQVFIRLHVDTEVTLSGSGVIADFTTVRFIAACVSLSPSQSGVWLSRNTVNT